MPVLKLTPTCKDYLWGDSRLRTDFGITVTVLSPLFRASGSRVAVCAVSGGCGIRCKSGQRCARICERNPSRQQQ